MERLARIAENVVRTAVADKYPGLNDVDVMKALARMAGARIDPRPDKGPLVDSWYLQAGKVLITVAYDMDGVLVEAATEENPYDILFQKTLTGHLDDRDVVKLIKGAISKGKRKAPSIRRAGDEWADSETYAFAKELARVMSSDGDVASARASGNVVEFVHQPSPLISVPLVMTLMEFGYEGDSESVNGTITSKKVRNFRVPGGYTRTRDPKELWKKGKENLEDIMRRAL